VELVRVDDAVLDRLIAVAVTDAAAPEVTPPLTPGESWTPERVDWLRSFHRDRRAGLDGGRQEATWAVVVDGEVTGSVRLRRTAVPGVLETGIWLAGSARGRGTGARALAALVQEARSRGCRELRAETRATNRPAMAVLTSVGFLLDPPDEAGVVTARLGIADPAPDGPVAG
jgi:RimJ/RimL family protein N-acetyltransferase